MRNKLSTRDITEIAMMAAVIEVCKMILASIPNVELTTFLLMMFSILYGYKVYYVVIIFILIEGLVYGFGLWWLQYLIVWPLLVFVTLRLKDHSHMDFVIVSCLFGLLFGLLCSWPYLFIGGIKTAFAWWIQGIPWDLVHGIANAFIMLVLYKPVFKVIRRKGEMH